MSKNLDPGFGYHYSKCKGGGPRIGGVFLIIVIVIVIWIHQNVKAIDHTVSEILIATFVTIGALSFISLSRIVYLIVQNAKRTPMHQMQSHYTCTCAECVAISPGRVVNSALESDTERLAIENTTLYDANDSDIIDEMVRRYNKRNR